MANEVTKRDLDEFKIQLIESLKQLLGQPTLEHAKWLKSYQVKNMLKISAGTLQNLRMNGTLRFTKIGGILYYKYDDILKILEGEKDKCFHHLYFIQLIGGINKPSH